MDKKTALLAESAGRAGVEALLQKVGSKPEDIHTVHVTGTFGLAGGPDALKTIAILPSIMLDKVVFVSNGVSEGIRRLLFIPGGGNQVQNLVKPLLPFPLSGTSFLKNPSQEHLIFNLGRFERFTYCRHKNDV